MVIKKIHDGRMFIMCNDYVTIPNQMKYYEELSRLDRYRQNIPKDLIGHNKHCLSFNIEGLEFAGTSVDISKTINKSLALINKFRSCKVSEMVKQPQPDLDKTYYEFMKDMILSNKHHSKPYKTWVVNDEILVDLFNTKMYMDLLSVIKSRLNNYKPVISHGNMYLDNLANQDNNLIIINPKADFGNGISILGDPRCDIAKIRIYASNVIKSIIENKFSVIENHDNVYSYIIFQDPYFDRMIEYLDSKLELYDIDFNEVLIFQASLYITFLNKMKSSDQKKILYFEALKIFNKILDNFRL